MGNSRFSDGFLMGAVAGGALVFLLGTKKGNQVLKLIMEEGRAGLGDLMDEIEEYRAEVEEAQIDEVVEVKEVVEDAPKETKSDAEKESSSSKPKSSNKRFFKKAK